ncbi:hypothetical protein [Clostridium botulinum]|uniref:Uncharacterized protein n=1 Tax=Clostridium botulinum CFSAN001627 TaxID=1232189 RepID=M1ZZE8_CLOBO|nr:hypothetical protein [Clostridium botulinum]EKN42950.1 hypothetical protein CFSAN001627_03495 [Clostridium botulinum CFSAN001627]APC82156.1 hypothetical protein NPD12_3797 [Clostridium botulinum]AXG97807.1 hypothetical protein AGE31_19655 [Clostridium botulinum]MBY6773643.1 hypothetical protein [Clostridium botulinum]MBY6850322.1 hypothetical protein [Clostridium botulinum]
MITETTQQLYLQLGIAGATLLILLICIVLIFKRLKDLNGSTTIEKLCSKIDDLVTINNKVLLSNDKDQKETLRLLKNLLETTTDTQKRVVRIDDRTYRCLGAQNERKEK